MAKSHLSKSLVTHCLLFAFGAVLSWAAWGGREPVPAELAPEPKPGASPGPTTGRGDPPRSRAAGVDLDPLEARLARIEDALAALAGAERAPVTRGSVPAEHRDLVARLDALQTALDAHVRAIGEVTQNARSLSSLRSENPDAKWPALRDVIEVWRKDEDAANRVTTMMSKNEVVAKYGAPTAHWVNNGGAHWMYGEGQNGAGLYLTEVYFRFQEGYVTEFGVAER
ncbi:MAG: hypothetical protein GY711_13940 [bacterium]|nr:hypothetical protein [bacterium]